MQDHSLPKLKGPLIFDSSAIFNFGHRGDLQSLLKILKEHYELIISPEVKKEICEKIEFRDYYEKLIDAYFKVSENVFSEISFDRILEIVDKIGNTDSSIIMLTLATKGTLVLDDKLARHEARSLGVRIIGTLGLLNYAKDANWISEKAALAACEMMRKQGFRISPIKDHLSFDQYLKSLEESKD